MPADNQFARWCEFVNEAHLHWVIRQNEFDHFPAFIREGRFADFRTTNLTASAYAEIKGIRRSPEIAKDSEALYNFLYIVKGSECLTIADCDIELPSGTLILWDSTRPMEFLTGKNLHQITLSVSHSRLERIFPRASEFVGIPIRCDTGINRLVVDHMLALDAQFGDLTKEQAWRVLDSTLNLATVALEGSAGTQFSTTSTNLLNKMREYIENNLEDYELNIEAIANKHQISVRHVHRLFGEIGLSPSNYITQKRLNKCKIDLLSPSSAKGTITDIAFRWGFNDSSTFSKIFKREFGLSPREFRRSAVF